MPRWSFPPTARRSAALRAWHGFMRHRGLDSAAALTFFAALSVLPGSLVIVSSFALLDNRQRARDELAAIVGTFAGDTAGSSVERLVMQLLSLDSPGIALAIGLVLLMWSVSGYSTAFGRAVNSVYEVHEGRQMWKFRGTMLGVGAVLITLAAGAAAILLITPTVTAEIAGNRGLGPVVASVWNIGKWALLPVIVFLVFGILYYFTPNVRLTHRRWASYGSLVAIVLWGAGTAGFGVFVTLIDRYDRIYGVLGLALVGFLWLYVTNLSLVFGAELDAEIVRLHKLVDGEHAEETIHLPVRDSARNLMLARQRDADIVRSRAIREAAETARDTAGGGRARG